MVDGWSRTVTIGTQQTVTIAALAVALDHRHARHDGEQRGTERGTLRTGEKLSYGCPCDRLRDDQRRVCQTATEAAAKAENGSWANLERQRGHAPEQRASRCRASCPVVAEWVC